MSVFIAVIALFVLPVVLWILNMLREPNTATGKTIHSVFVSYLCILLVVVFGGGILFSVKDKIGAIKKQKEGAQQAQYSSAYAAGYDDALHGVRPSVENVKCFSCGASYSDYADINFYEFSSVYVPICQNCVEKHDYTNPIVVFGEEYFFSPAKAQE